MIESIKKEKKDALREKNFFTTFGAWESELSAEDLAKEIRESRNFRNREIDL